MPYIHPDAAPTKSKRRRFTAEQKKAIVEEALAPGASVSRVARAHDLNTNQVFKWMRQYQGNPQSARTTPALIPILLDQTDVIASSVAAEPSIVATGTIELHFPKGRVCLSGAVDSDTLRIVLEHLAT